MLNQRGYYVDQRRDVISTYINVESTLSVCWAASNKSKSVSNKSISRKTISDESKTKPGKFQ